MKTVSLFKWSALHLFCAAIMMLGCRGEDTKVELVWQQPDALPIEADNRLADVLVAVRTAIPEVMKEDAGFAVFAGAAGKARATVFGVYRVEHKGRVYFVAQTYPGTYGHEDREKADSSYMNRVETKLAEQGKQLEGCYLQGFGFTTLVFREDGKGLVYQPWEKAKWGVAFRSRIPEAANLGEVMDQEGGAKEKNGATPPAISR